MYLALFNAREDSGRLSTERMVKMTREGGCSLRLGSAPAVSSLGLPSTSTPDFAWALDTARQVMTMWARYRLMWLRANWLISFGLLVAASGCTASPNLDDSAFGAAQTAQGAPPV